MATNGNRNWLLWRELMLRTDKRKWFLPEIKSEDKALTTVNISYSFNFIEASVMIAPLLVDFKNIPTHFEALCFIIHLLTTSLPDFLQVRTNCKC